MKSLIRSPWQNPKFWFMWPGLYLYFRGSQRARIIVFAEDKVLLVRDRWTLWFYDSHWALPGGGLHTGEAPVVAAVRELQEEIGLSVAPSALELLGTEKVSEYGFSYQGHFMLLRFETIPTLTLQATEIVESMWCPVTEIDNHDLKNEVKQAIELLKQIN